MTPYLPIDPFALQRGQQVQVRPPAGETALPATVNLVDTSNFYISVIFDGGTLPVALPSADWLFEALDTTPPVPDEDGFYVKPEEVNQGMNSITALYRRSQGIWTNVMGTDPTAVIAEEDLPVLAPFRAFAPPSASTATSPITIPNSVEETT